MRRPVTAGSPTAGGGLLKGRSGRYRPPHLRCRVLKELSEPFHVEHRREHRNNMEEHRKELSKEHSLEHRKKNLSIEKRNLSIEKRNLSIEKRNLSIEKRNLSVGKRTKFPEKSFVKFIYIPPQTSLFNFPSKDEEVLDYQRKNRV